MEDFTPFHHYGDPPESLNSDALRLCMDSNEYVTLDELFAGPSSLNVPHNDFHESQSLESFIDPGGPSDPIDDNTQFDYFIVDGQDEGVDGNAGDPDTNNDPLLGNNLHILPFEGQNDDHIGEFQDVAEDPIEEEGENENAEDENLENYESARPLAIWPPQPVPFSCSSCQVLRDIVHSNGTCVTKLEIHGRVGILCHGVIEVRYNVDENPSVTHTMIDFCLRSLEDVKNYILQYCQDRKAAGFVMVSDPLSTFYGALCVDLNRDENGNTSEPNEALEPETGAVHPVIEDNVLQLPQRSLAEQRKRAANLKLSDLVEYFHMTIEAASKRLAFCPTTIKKTCRDYGLKRWPYRKIKAIEREIRMLEKKLGKNNDAPIRAKILQLQQNKDSYLIVSDTPVPGARR